MKLAASILENKSDCEKNVAHVYEVQCDPSSCANSMTNVSERTASPVYAMTRVVRGALLFLVSLV